MKLNIKIIAIIGICSFIPAVILLLTSSITLPVFSIMMISCIIMIISIYALIIRRIKQLKKRATHITHENEFYDRLPLTANDEITSIESSFNVLLNTIEIYQHEMEQEVNDKIRDIQETKKNHDQHHLLSNDVVLKLSQNDNLTSLPNGIFFNEILNKTIKHAERRNQYLAILLLELDLLKTSNENDDNEISLVIKEIGKRLSNVLRKEDTLAKLENDAFIILLSDINQPKFASMVAEKLLNVCSQAIKINDKELTVTPNIGICIFPADGHSLEELLDKANQAAFKAKLTGGNSYQFFTQEMHVEAKEYIQLESALRKAIHNNELALYYQPIFRLQTGLITGVEALLRWEHPVLGIVDPSKFVQLAEDSGLIITIGEWALQEAAERIKYWQEAGFSHLSIAIKFSAKQFHHNNIDLIIKKAITNANIDPKYIEIEITEKTVMENTEVAATMLKKIKDTGVQISIDHFGIGHTSIQYLKQFPLSNIKIDKSYVKGLPNNPDDNAIVTAVIGLAHNLGLEVIAEGVETVEQVKFLSTLNCNMLQGYFLGHPVSSQKIIAHFKKLQEEVMF